MTTYKKAHGAPKPLPVDTESALKEGERREMLASNTAHQAGVQQALAQFRSNTEGEMRDARSSLAKTTLERDKNRPSRESYDRSWNRCRAVAERLAEITGEGVAIPEYLPALLGAENTVIVHAAKVDGGYRETKGMGPSGKGLPTPPVFGSAADVDWVKS